MISRVPVLSFIEHGSEHIEVVFDLFATDIPDFENPDTAS